MVSSPDPVAMMDGSAGCWAMQKIESLWRSK